ncbi:hypothetical protein [Streptomyces sp. NPDC005799]|uniref:hypothetical protein n=1 Tax=Streptomyces sp. NPDC005799 TaxID=3154678 RepID=UPI0033E1DE2F
MPCAVFETAWPEKRYFAWFPLQNPGIVSIPVGFLLGWLGSLLSGRQETEAYDEFELRTLMGADQS